MCHRHCAIVIALLLDVASFETGAMAKDIVMAKRARSCRCGKIMTPPSTAVEKGLASFDEDADDGGQRLPRVTACSSIVTQVQADCGRHPQRMKL